MYQILVQLGLAQLGLKVLIVQLQVVDIKEARIDAILLSITQTMLVYLPETAVDPNTLYLENLLRRDDISKYTANIYIMLYFQYVIFYCTVINIAVIDSTATDIQLKSWNAEIAVIELIHKFLDSVPCKEIQNLKDDW